MSAERWAEAALEEIEGSGVAGLSVEAAARRLGVSKGGAYHHFSDRRALLAAALALWRERQVDALNAHFRQQPDPRARLHAILHYALVARAPTVILQLQAAAGANRDVAEVLAYATRERLALLEEVFTDLGAIPADARDRALLVYGHYLGLAQLRAQDPEGAWGSPARARAHVRRLETLLRSGLESQ